MDSTRPHRFPALSQVVHQLGQYKTRVVCIVFLGLVVSSIQPLSVRLTEKLMSELQKGKSIDPSFFKWVPLALIGLFLVSGLAKYFYNTLRRTLSERIISNYREELFSKYLSLSLSSIDQKKTGELLSSLQNDLSQSNLGLETLSTVLKEPFTFLGLMGVALYCDWKLTLSTLLVAPLIALLFSRTGSAVKRYSVRNLQNFSELLSLAQESLVGSRVVKVFSLEPLLKKKFQIIQERYLSTVMKSIRVQELATPLVELMGACLIAGVVTYAGVATSRGDLTPSELIAFIIAIGLAQMPLKELNNAFLKLKNAEAAAERVYRILNEPSRQVSSASKRMKGFSQGITFEKVSLKYGNKLALNQVSFSVKCGESIALVGRSGSGKTSVVNLLPRLYEPSEGRIYVDQTPLEDICLADLRQLFSFVTQDTFLFHDTIYNNILLGNPGASAKEIEQACELAYCQEFIQNLPLGLQTVVGDRGMMLSGGERQRVSIARAFLRKAPILVLDEATSNLDSHSELLVQKALQSLSQEKTTFIIAHRLASVKSADQILLFENGSLIEKGNHEELLNRATPYREALAMQSLN